MGFYSGFKGLSHTARKKLRNRKIGAGTGDCYLNHCCVKPTHTPTISHLSTWRV